MSGTIDYRDELDNIRESIDLLVRKNGQAITALERIATALETIAAEAVDQQSERRYRVRRRYATITRWIAEASPETNKIVLQWERDRLLVENPWLQDEVQS